MSKREIVNLLELNGVDLGKLTEIVIRRAAEENRPQWDVLKEELFKIAQGQTDQSKAQEHKKYFKDIVSLTLNNDKKKE